MECFFVSEKNIKIVAKVNSTRRRRRRPRNDDMGDLDISLIKEFARRPGFYDRSNPNFKDKIYVQQAWNEISNQLGYDAHLLKDRMYQLRNRYNLEKRRLENIRNEDPSNPVRSPWPLFYHLTFLDGHIRPRRSYKRMMRRRLAGAGAGGGGGGPEDHTPSDSNMTVIPSSKMLVGAGSLLRANGSVDERQYYSSPGKHPDVKYETEVDSEEEQEMPEVANGTHYIDASNFLADESDNAGSETQSNYPPLTPAPNSAGHDGGKMNGISNGNCGGAGSGGGGGQNGSITGNGINIRNIESLRRELCMDDSNPDPHQPPPKKRLKMSRFEKFEAFGRFLSVSLCDLSEQKALSLVEKFTSDVVQALLEKN